MAPAESASDVLTVVPLSVIEERPGHAPAPPPSSKTFSVNSVLDASTEDEVKQGMPPEVNPAEAGYVLPLTFVALLDPVPLTAMLAPVGTVKLPGKIMAGSSETTGVVVPVATSI
jgi:hypothetical protein